MVRLSPTSLDRINEVRGVAFVDIKVEQVVEVLKKRNS